jgi:hypothetical protein
MFGVLQTIWMECEIMIMRYKKKPIIIEAVCFTKDSEDLCYSFITCQKWIEHLDNKAVFKIQTLEGVMTATQGDYIIKGVNGEFYPCKPDIFEKTYDQYNG